MLGFFRLTRLSKRIVSSVTGGYDGLFDSDSLFISIGGDMILLLLSTRLGVVKDSLEMKGAGLLVGVKPERHTDVSMTKLFDLDMHMLQVLRRCFVYFVGMLWRV